MENEHSTPQKTENSEGKTPEIKQDKPKKNLGREIISWLVVLAVAFGISFVVRNVIIVNAMVPTGSMRETIETSSRLIAFRLSYLFSEPDRLDVIVFRSHLDGETLYVKRIIGMPGERVDIIGGEVFINQSPLPLDEWYLREPAHGANQSFVVPEGAYFVMGDNRNDSRDSRAWQDPFVPKENILGRAVLVYFPRPSLIH